MKLNYWSSKEITNIGVDLLEDAQVLHSNPRYQYTKSRKKRACSYAYLKTKTSFVQSEVWILSQWNEKF